MNTTEKRKFEYWIEEFFQDEAFFKTLKDDFSENNTLSRFRKYVHSEAAKEAERVNFLLLANPELKYGRDFIQQRFETLKKIISNLAGLQEKGTPAEIDDLKTALKFSDDEAFILERLRPVFINRFGEWTKSKTEAARMIKALNELQFFKTRLHNSDLISLLENSFKVNVSERTMNIRDNHGFIRLFSK